METVTTIHRTSIYIQDQCKYLRCTFRRRDWSRIILDSITKRVKGTIYTCIYIYIYFENDPFLFLKTSSVRAASYGTNIMDGWMYIHCASANRTRYVILRRKLREFSRVSRVSQLHVQYRSARIVDN